jgi:hypothetical protein
MIYMIMCAPEMSEFARGALPEIGWRMGALQARAISLASSTYVRSLVFSRRRTCSLAQMAPRINGHALPMNIFHRVPPRTSHPSVNFFGGIQKT